MPTRSKFSPSKVKEATQALPGILFRKGTPRKTAPEAGPPQASGQCPMSSPRQCPMPVAEPLHPTLHLGPTSPPLSDRARGVLEAVAAAASFKNVHQPSHLRQFAQSCRWQDSRGDSTGEGSDDSLGRKTRREAVAHHLTRWPSAPEDSFGESPPALTRLDPSVNERPSAHALAGANEAARLDCVNVSSGSSLLSDSFTSPLPSPRADRPLWLPPPTPVDGLRPRGAKCGASEYAEATDGLNADVRSEHCTYGSPWSQGIAYKRYCQSPNDSQDSPMGRCGYRVPPTVFESSQVLRKSPSSDREHDSWSYTVSTTQSMPTLGYGSCSQGPETELPDLSLFCIPHNHTTEEGADFLEPLELAEPEVKVEIEAEEQMPIIRPVKLKWNVCVRIGQGEKVVKGQTLLQASSDGRGRAINGGTSGHSHLALPKQRLHRPGRFQPRPLLLPSSSNQSLSSSARQSRGIPDDAASCAANALGSTVSLDRHDVPTTREPRPLATLSLQTNDGRRGVAVPSVQSDARRGGKARRPYLSGGFDAVRVVTPVRVARGRADTQDAPLLSQARAMRAKVCYDVNRRPGGCSQVLTRSAT